MTDAGGFRQAGRARGVDQERGIIDRDLAPLGGRKRASIQAVQGCRDVCITVVPVPPDFRRELEMGQHVLEDACKFIPDNDVIRSSDVDAVRERAPHQLGIDECRDAADPGDTEPGRDVIGRSRHEETDHIAGADALREGPARVTIYTPGKCAIAERLAIRQQRRPFRLSFGPFIDDVREQPVGIGLDAGSKLDGFQPALRRGRFAASLRLARRLRNCRMLNDARVHGRMRVG